MTASPLETETPSRPYTDPNAARDLGFGIRVADNSRVRLLNKNGSFNVVRRGLTPWTTLAPYHALLTMGWGKFLGLVLVFYVSVNTLFAFGYLACGPGRLIGPGIMGMGSLWSDFLRAFFFSVETFGTIGYGNIVPLGLMANVVMTCESVVALLSVALATGLVFARFARPTALILYSHHAVMAPYKQMSAFMFRCANQRSNQLVDVSVKVIYSRLEARENGERIRSFTLLPLEFEKVTFFMLSWTVVHPIDEASPLWGHTEEDLIHKDAEFMILISGTDETFAQTVHSRTSYKTNEIVWGAKFRPIFVESRESGVTGMDLSRIHDIEPVDGERAPLAT
ncbi:MAG TPA: ion channel [Gemmatimonadaceae bacterium]|nr:ion channel [Gemmatimonadaceae bacterium]